MYLYELFDSFLIDLDGVIYIGDNPTYKAAQSINRLNKTGKNIILITNDPRRSPSEYASKLESIKIYIDQSHIITSSRALCIYLSNIYNLKSMTAFVIGSTSLKQQVRKTGIKIKSRNSDNISDFVIVGGHNKVTYDDLKKATLCIRNGAKFYATNYDNCYPSPEGLIPGTGALVTSIETASGKKAKIVGKPKKIMFNVAKQTVKNIGRCAVIGDSIDTDISGGKKAGMKTILTLTGSTSKVDLAKSKLKPDYVIINLSYLFKDYSLSVFKNS